jgi:hypothetical protein
MIYATEVAQNHTNGSFAAREFNYALSGQIIIMNPLGYYRI